MNNFVWFGIAITVFGIIAWFRGFFITRHGYKTSGVVTGYKPFAKKHWIGEHRKTSYREYPTIRYTDKQGTPIETYVEYDLSDNDRFENGQEINIIVYHGKAYYGHDLSSPFFIYLGVFVLIIGLIIKLF